MESNSIEFRVFEILRTESEKIIEEKQIATKIAMNEAHQYLSNTVKYSEDEMAHKKFYYSKYLKTTLEDSKEEVWVFDEKFGRMYVGPKTAKGILENLD